MLARARGSMRAAPVWLPLRCSASAKPLRAFTSISMLEGDGSTWNKRPTPRPQGTEFALLAPALAAFHRTTDHFLVPYHFPVPPRYAPDGTLIKRETVDKIVGVPDDPALFQWPEEVANLNVGRVLHKFATNPAHHTRYPRVVADLRAIGFPIDEDWKAYQWYKLTVMPLTIYYKLKGHSLVPTDFVVPHGDARWPEHTWGFRLGKRVQRVRRIYNELDPHELEDLHRVEFTPDLAELTWKVKVLPSLATFSKEFGHCFVKRTFVVPSREPWPQKAWGVALGSMVNSIRTKSAYQDQIARDTARLNAIGFIWNHRASIWNDGILPALEVFHRLYGHARIPRSFVVPSSDPWPKTAWDHALGVTVNHIRAKGAYKQEIQQDLDRINAISFIWSMREYRWREIILASLEVFADRYGHCRVPRDFIVPACDPWPEDAWELSLGTLVYGIRYYGSYAKFVSEDEQHLRIIGFM